MSGSHRAVHVVVSGRVQGVGYRAFVEREAEGLGLIGWVRNRADGSVEAVFSGETALVDEMIARCRKGPRAALVSGVRVGDYVGPSLSGFTVLPTA